MSFERGCGRRRAIGAAGFTLVEVMVALAIVGIGMIAAFSAVSQIVHDTAYLRDKTLANWIAMNQMTDIRLEGGLPETGDRAGEVEFVEQRWRWVARVSETPVETLRRIEIDVARAEDPDAVLITLSGFASAAINLQPLGSPWLPGLPNAPEADDE